MSWSRISVFLAGSVVWCLAVRPGFADETPTTLPFEANPQPVIRPFYADPQPATQPVKIHVPPATQPVDDHVFQDRLKEVTKNFQKIDSKYYLIYTDLDEDFNREATARLTAMFEEYCARTRDYNNGPPAKAPVYFFSKDEDYLSAVPPECAQSAGIYCEPSLLVRTSGSNRTAIWRTMQHEGFHQFVHQAITGKMPVWANEGLAEYFETGIWTGDAMITGYIYLDRMQRVRWRIKAREIMPFDQMLAMTREQWSAVLKIENYDQAWSMVHFLVHGYEGKFVKQFVAFINDVSSQKEPGPAFKDRFKLDPAALQRSYSTWWLDRRTDFNKDLDDQIVVRILTNYLARAQAAKLTFRSYEDFRSAARDGRLRKALLSKPETWLPDDLLAQTIEQADRRTGWSLEKDKNNQPSLKLEFKDGTTYRGEFDPKTLKPTVRYKRGDKNPKDGKDPNASPWSTGK